MSAGALALLICLFASLYGVGMIWVLQLNHYPLYAKVGRDAFQDYIVAHNQRLLFPIILPGTLAFAAAIALLWWRPPVTPAWSVWLSIGLLTVNLGSTILVQGPAHNALARDGYSEPVVRRIIATNWLRTAAWTANGLLLLWMAGQAIEAQSAGGLP